MPVRFLFSPVRLTPGSLLHHYWTGVGYFRPTVDAYAIGPNGNSLSVVAALDTCSDWVVFDARVAVRLGLHPPFSRVVTVSGIAGTVSLFLTDYRAWCFLPTLPVGFWPPAAPGQPSRRNVLGFNGFLQHFEVLSRNYLNRPEVELIEAPTFPGSFGPFPSRLPLDQFLRSLKIPD